MLLDFFLIENKYNLLSSYVMLVKTVKIHDFSSSDVNTYDSAQTQTNFAQLHDCKTVTFISSALAQT